MESKKPAKKEDINRAIKHVQDKIDWSSSLRDVKYSLTFLMRNPSHKYSDKRLKRALGNESDSDLSRVVDDDEQSKASVTDDGSSDIENGEKLSARLKRKEALAEKLKKELIRKITKQAIEKEAARQLDDEDNFYTNYEENLQFDIFKNEDYQPFFDNSVWEDYEDLVYAIQRDKYDQVLTICNNEAIPPSEGIRPTGDNLMHVCAEFGRVKMLTHFNKNGGDLWSKNYAEELPLHLAAREGHVETLTYILDQAVIPVDIKTVDEWTPFHYAVNNGYLAAVEFLVSKGANVNSIDRFNRSALHWAVRYNFVEIVEYLLGLNINTDLIDKEGRTALDIAKAAVNMPILSLFSDHNKAKLREKKSANNK